MKTEERQPEGERPGERKPEENNPEEKQENPYASILDLPHHKSETRPPMSLLARAAQFAPFAALSGYDEVVRETARLTERRITLSETEKERLNRKLSLIAESLAEGERPRVRVTWFCPDGRKEGGEYRESDGEVKKIDTVEGKIVLNQGVDASDEVFIDIEAVLDMAGELVDWVDMAEA